MEPLLRTENVSKIYHSHRPDEMRAVTEVSLAVRSAEVAVLRGPSGSGKTTLLGMLGCMSRPTSGRIVVAGRDVGRLPERFLTEVRRSTFGFIFQQLQLLPEVSVLENVLLPLYPLPMGFAEMRERANALLDRFGLAGKRGTKAGRLSGGEQQRVAVARALINAPRVLIADEPTAHLDRRHAGELLGLLTELNGEGMTIVIASHDPFVCEHPLVTRTFEMRDGRIEGESGR